MNWVKSNLERFLDVDAEDRNYFKTIKTTLKLAGMYPCAGSRGCALSLFLAYDALMLHLLLLLLATLPRAADIPRFAFTTVNLIVYGNGVLFLVYYQSQSAYVRDMFMFAEANFKTQSAPGPVRVSFSPALRTARLAALVLTTCTFVTSHQWTIVPLLNDSPDGERQLPIAVDYPGPVQQSPGYEVAYVLQALAQCIMAIEYSSIGCLFLTFSLLVCKQFDILCASIRNAGVSRAPITFAADGGAGAALLTEDQERYMSECYDKYVVGGEEYARALRSCVRHHLVLLQLCRRMDLLFRPALFTQLSGIVLMSCTALYSATLKFELKTLEYVFISMLHLLCFCYFGHSITTKAEQVSTAVWASAWCAAREREGRRVAVLLTQMAQRPPVLTAGAIFKLHLTTFVDMGKTSFSFYTLLRNMQDKKEL